MKTYDELVQMHQNGEIGWMDFLLMGDMADDYQQWCQNHNEEPTEDNAELYVEMCDNHSVESDFDGDIDGILS